MHELIDTTCTNLHLTCMKLAKGKEPKVQRGISLDKELRDRIQKDADRLGMTWNEAAERGLSQAFPCVPNSHKSGTVSIESGEPLPSLEDE